MAKGWPKVAHQAVLMLHEGKRAVEGGGIDGGGPENEGGELHHGRHDEMKLRTR